MISLLTESTYMGASGSRFNVVHVCWYSFYRLGRTESLVNFSGKEGHTDIQPLTMPGIEPGTIGLGGRDLTTVPTPPQIGMYK